VERLKEDIKGNWLGMLLAVLVFFLMDAIVGKVCAWRFILGIPCPACGMTRAWGLLLHGKFVEAFYMHQMYPFVVLGGCLFVYTRYISKRYSKIWSRYGIILLLASITLYIYRMVSWFPNQAPMLYDADSILGRIITLIQVRSF